MEIRRLLCDEFGAEERLHGREVEGEVAFAVGDEQGESAWEAGVAGKEAGPEGAWVGGEEGKEVAEVGEVVGEFWGWEGGGLGEVFGEGETVADGCEDASADDDEKG